MSKPKKEEAISIEEKIDELGTDILAKRFDIIRRLSSNKKINESEQIALDEMQQQFKHIQATYFQMKKMNKATGRSDEKFSDEILKRVKEKTSSLSAIVTKTT